MLRSEGFGFPKITDMLSTSLARLSLSASVHARNTPTIVAILRTRMRPPTRISPAVARRSRGHTASGHAAAIDANVIVLAAQHEGHF